MRDHERPRRSPLAIVTGLVLLGSTVPLPRLFAEPVDPHPQPPAQSEEQPEPQTLPRPEPHPTPTSEVPRRVAAAAGTSQGATDKYKVIDKSLSLVKGYGESARFTIPQAGGREFAHSTSKVTGYLSLGASIAKAGEGAYQMYRDESTGNLMLKQGAADVEEAISNVGVGAAADAGLAAGVAHLMATGGATSAGVAGAALWGAYTAGTWVGEGIDNASKDWTSDGQKFSDHFTDAYWSAGERAYYLFNPEEDPLSPEFEQTWLEKRDAARAKFQEESQDIQANYNAYQQEQFEAAIAAEQPSPGDYAWLDALLAGTPPPATSSDDSLDLGEEAEEKPSDHCPNGAFVCPNGRSWPECGHAEKYACPPPEYAGEARKHDAGSGVSLPHP